jgi:DNA primase
MAERRPELQDIKDQIDLIDLIARDEPLEKHGDTFRSGHESAGHGSQSGTCLDACPTKQLYLCRSCGEKGDIFSWVMNRRNCTFLEARQWLCETFNIPLPEMTPEEQAKLQAARDEKQRIRPILKEIMQFFHDSMEEPHWEYYRVRGATDDTIKELLLGYAPPDPKALADFMRDKHPAKDLYLTGLFHKTKDSAIPIYLDRLVFPYWRNGEAVYSIGRLPHRNLEPVIPESERHETDKGPYKKHLLYKPATGKDKVRTYVSQHAVEHVIYGIDTIRGADEIVITEGVVDALLAIQQGFPCLSPVTTKFSDGDIENLVRLTRNVETVYIANDNEESGAGLKGALSTAHALFEAGRDVRIVALPRPDDVEKIDLADFLSQDGKLDENTNALKKLMADSPDFIEWKISEAEDLPRREQSKALTEIAPWVAGRNEAERERYIDLIVEKGLIKRQAFKAMIKQARIENARARKAERMQKAEATLPPEAFLKLRIADIRKAPYRKAFEIKREVSDLILAEMKEQGKFYQTSTHQFFWFDLDAKVLYPIGDDRLGTHINSRYGVNQSEAEHEFLTNDLRTEAEVNGEQTDVHQFAFYDKTQHVLYVSNHANQIYRLNGESVDLVDNGTDGVLFLGDPLHEPFEYKPKAGGAKIWSLVVDPIAFAPGGEVNLNPDEQKQIFLIWVYSLFFESLQPTKPLQFFLGPKGSGKTTRQRIIGRWLFGKHFDVIPINREKEDSFVAAITNNCFVALDNVDANIPWLPDRLAQTATGQRIQLRELYTTNTERVYFPKCFLSLNAREPKFKRDDVVDRLLLFRVERIEKFRAERDILGEIETHRDALWSELLDDLNQIVAALKTDNEKFTSPFRMADWAELGWRIAKIGGKAAEFLRLLEKMDRARSEFLIEDHPIVECLEAWIDNPDNVRREVKVSQLFEEFSAIAQEHKIAFGYKSPKSLGIQLRHILSNLSNDFEVGERKVSKIWHYTFVPKTDENEGGS